ncbi:MAG TPA: crotonase/enoyl-CoA hydratase family protein, partial [Ilumatobacteraceae bacterium]|nr:crotonase/enoyl-CoA hydratase family protein [Ilumatobacteraceae bacterium]
LSTQTIADIRRAVEHAEETDGIGAVVLTGRDGKFCAGFDLGVMRGDDVQAMANLVSDGGDLVADLYGAKLPVVAACNGHALAAGALILLGCSVRIGADVPCKIGLNEVAIGMVLPEWAFTIAEERLSRRHVARAIPLAEISDAHGAADAGYLDEVVPADQLLETAVQRAEALCDLHPKAYALTVEKMRGELVQTMHNQANTDRLAGSTPNV